MRQILANLIALVCVHGGGLGFVSFAADQPVDYLKEIKPVLRERCYACHGALKQNGSLRLDTAALIVKGGDSGSAVEMGSADRSVLIQRITASDEAERMPPEGLPLTASQIDSLRRWIDQSARGPSDEQPDRDPRDHWAFRTPARPELPVVNHPGWVQTPVDAFIAFEHQRLGLKAQPPADKRLWLRRVTLDLIGLPPTQAELEAFVADDSPDASEKVVNRLLDSPQYGERWGRHWMDIWRYSDPWGLGAEIRNSQRHIWHWRDWIVESLNADAGYDQMLREMLAADELYPQDLDKLRASGYLARQYFKFNRTVWLDETIEHLSKAMLGLTINCAKCHDHKYDPFTQEDYYAFRAIFEPYQVRTDLVPGEIDVEKAGLPRAFDCNLDTPTFLHIRGDDRNPDKSRQFAPAVPRILDTDRWSVTPVQLPIDAVQPGLRPFVVEAYLNDADRRIAAARAELDDLEKRMSGAAGAENLARLIKLTDGGKTVVRDEIVDDFGVDRPELWQKRGGNWSYSGGHLKQSATGATRAVLSLKAELPIDFESRLRFVTTGGDVWKSVGISFDVRGVEHEILAYLSAYAGGPKSQISYIQQGTVVYPADGLQAREVALNQPHELVLRVRGTLINLLVDGQHSIAYRVPIARESGPLEVIAFDAQVEFHQFSLRPLPADAAMIEASNSLPVAAVASLPAEQAELTVAIARKALAAALTVPAAIKARAAADLAQVQSSEPETLERLIAEAARSERMTAAAKADEEVSRAQLALLKAPAETRNEADKKLTAAKQALESARKAINDPATSYTRISGALKTLESNLETAESQARPFPHTSTGRRTALAQWLTDDRNPLTARVAVNHVWARHLGKPLVPTVFEFGRKGLPPTHPELLDWLAVEFMEHRWSFKHLHRIIVLSSTYRMTSSTANADPATAATDPDNRYHWHGTAVRMESQAIRDSLLSLAGELELTRGGLPVPVADESSRRRSLYYVHSHNDHQKFLSVFDDASVLDCYRRSESIVPQQALALENSPLTVQMAEKIAQRIAAEKPNLSDADFVRDCFLRILNFEPNDSETSAVLEAIQHVVESARKGNHADPHAAARLAVVLALLNHNDFITIR